MKSRVNWVTPVSNWVTPVFDEEPVKPAEVKSDDVKSDGVKPAEPVKQILFTQDQLNSKMAENKRKLQKQNETLIKQLESLKKTADGSEATQTALSQQIESLKTQHMTAKELADRETNQLREDAKNTAAQLGSERDLWMGRFQESTIAREILDSANKNGAVNPSQLSAMLSNSTKLEEDKDEAGNPLGTFSTKVLFNDTDKDGKAFQATYTVSETVKRMKELPEYGNLFKSTIKAGVGGDNNTAQTSKVDFSDLESYRKNRSAFVKK